MGKGNNLYKIPTEWKGIDNYTWRHVVSSPEERMAIIVTPDIIKDKEATLLEKREAQRICDEWYPETEHNIKDIEKYQEYDEGKEWWEDKERVVDKIHITELINVQEWIDLPTSKGKWWGKKTGGEIGNIS